MEITIRKVKRIDIDEMNRIANDEMKTNGNSLDIDPKDYNYRLEWLAEHDKTHPVFVGELDGRMVCWAALSRYSSDYPYDGVANLSMHIDSAAGVQGLQESLLRFMEAQAGRLGYYKLIITVFASNRTALHCYRTAGYRDVGVFRNHGFYKGELVDIVEMERMLPVDMEKLKEYYRRSYPFYEEFFCREEVVQEMHMLRNGMMRSPDDPDKWIPEPKEANYQDDWGGTVRKAADIPSLEELVEQRLATVREAKLNGGQSETAEPQEILPHGSAVIEMGDCGNN